MQGFPYATGYAVGSSSVLEDTAKALIKRSSATIDDVNFQKTCVRELMSIATSVGPEWKVRPFGSTVNGFRTRYSDLDVSCFEDITGLADLSPEELQRKKDIGIETLRSKLVPLLNESPNFEVIEERWHARIPIVCLRFQKSLDVDVSMCNTEPFANTQLLKAYSKLHFKVRQLVVLVKLWAEGECVCGPKEGHLSSYALTLMTIYFLQVDEYIRMPCLPTDAFDGSGYTAQAPLVSFSCELTLDVLLHRFLSFFSCCFSWGDEVISIRTGRRESISEHTYCQLAGHNSHIQRLHIEDPFLLHRNLNCVLKDPQEHVLWTKICEAYVVSQRGMVPMGLTRCKGALAVPAPVELRVPLPELAGKDELSVKPDELSVKPEKVIKVYARGTGSARASGLPSSQLHVRSANAPSNTIATNHASQIKKASNGNQSMPAAQQIVNARAKEIAKKLAVRAPAPAPEDVPSTLLMQSTRSHKTRGHLNVARDIAQEESWTTVSL